MSWYVDGGWSGPSVSAGLDGRKGESESGDGIEGVMEIMEGGRGRRGD